MITSKFFQKLTGKAQVELIRLSEQFLKKNGFDIIPSYYVKHPILLRLEHIAGSGYDLVLDVGANTGQFAKEIRYNGYKQKIISFEPLDECFKVLSEAAKNDPLWEVSHHALGEKPEQLSINISENRYSSSILNIGTSHLEAEPKSQVYTTQEISVICLDDIYSGICSPSDKVFFKIDTQGYELKVLSGAEKCLKNISGLQVEMSLRVLYDSQPLFYDIYNYLTNYGFKLVSLEPSFIDASTHELLQVDGLFLRIF